MNIHSELSAARGLSEFGKDFGLMHEVIITGRKVGADKHWWTLLIKDKALFAKVVAYAQDIKNGLCYIRVSPNQYKVVSQNQKGDLLPEEFGADIEFMGKIVRAGRKVGANKPWWTLLAHDEDLFTMVVTFVKEIQLGIKHTRATLEWKPDFGEVNFEDVQVYFALFGNAGGWRLPTERELDPALRAMHQKGFHYWKYYWTSTPYFDGHGLTVTYRHNEGLGSMSHERLPVNGQKHPRLRLCRAKAIE